jgi:hypothetical protein
MKNRTILFISPLLVVNLTACGLLGDRGDCDEVPGMLRVTLPPSASDVTERCSKGINPTYRATFTMSPDDLESFKRSTPISDWETDASEAVSFDNQAAKATSLLFGDSATAPSQWKYSSTPAIQTTMSCITRRHLSIDVVCQLPRFSRLRARRPVRVSC